MSVTGTIITCFVINASPSACQPVFQREESCFFPSDPHKAQTAADPLATVTAAPGGDAEDALREGG